MARQTTVLPASSILQGLHDHAPAGPITLLWLMQRLRQQSFGVIALILGIAAMAPGVSIVARFLLLVVAFQMMVGFVQLQFPAWLAKRALPTRQVYAVMQRVIPVLACLETTVHGRLALPPEASKRIVGLAILVLDARLLLSPLPLSNIAPAAIIVLIALTYLEHDGLLLIVALLAAGVFLAAEIGLAHAIVHILS